MERKISKEDKVLQRALQRKLTEFFRIYGSKESVPKGGRYMNFRCILYFKNGTTSMRFLTKERALQLSKNFVPDNLFGGKVSRLVINLKFRPEIKICDLDIQKIKEQARIEAAKMYGIFS